jgi:hypothetical protein
MTPILGGRNNSFIWIVILAILLICFCNND